MADYYQPTVVQQIIPDADMTPLERLLLGEIFQSERVNDGWYFFAEDNPAVVITVQRAELDQALAAPHDRGNSAYRCVIEQIETADPETVEVDLDLSTTSWEFFLQDIVKRSTTLAYISVVAALTCNRMRADGFGGLAILITPDAIVGKSTGDFLEDMIAEAGLDNEERPGTKTSDSPAAASCEREG